MPPNGENALTNVHARLRRLESEEAFILDPPVFQGREQGIRRLSLSITHLCAAQSARGSGGARARGLLCYAKYASYQINLDINTCAKVWAQPLSSARLAAAREQITSFTINARSRQLRCWNLIRTP
jgi:hypothetical protein